MRGRKGQRGKAGLVATENNHSWPGPEGVLLMNSIKKFSLIKRFAARQNYANNCGNSQGFLRVLLARSMATAVFTCMHALQLN
jgi:hypothetical protein